MAPALSVPVPRAASVASESRAGSVAGSIRGGSKTKYLITNLKGEQVGPSDLSQYGLQIRIEMGEEAEMSVDCEGEGFVAEGGDGEEHSDDNENAEGTALATVATSEEQSVESQPTTSSLSATAPAFQPSPRMLFADFAETFHASGSVRPAQKYQPAPLKYNYLGGSMHAPPPYRTRPVDSSAGSQARNSDPDHQLLAGHRVSSYPALNPVTAEEHDNTDKCLTSAPVSADSCSPLISLLEHGEAEARVESSLSLSTITDLEQLNHPSSPTSSKPQTPLPQTDGAFADQESALAVLGDSFAVESRIVAPVGAALTDFDDETVSTDPELAVVAVEDPATALTVFDEKMPAQDDVDNPESALTLHGDTPDSEINSQALVLETRRPSEVAEDIEVEKLRHDAREGARAFDYEGHYAGTAEACINMTRYAYDCGIKHGIYITERHTNLNNQDRRIVVHCWGCTCEEAQKVQRELARVKREKDWQGWKTWEAKEQIAKLAAAHNKEKEDMEKKVAEHEEDLKEQEAAYEVELAELRADLDDAEQDNQVLRLRINELTDEATNNREALRRFLASVGQQ